MKPGTGKSWLGAYFFGALGIQCALVVCPRRVVDVWPQQLELHSARDFHMCVLGDQAGSVEQKARALRQACEVARARSKRLVAIVNYDACWREPLASLLLQQRWGMICCDEIHRIKSPTGRASKFMGLLGRRAQYRLGLSGTPMGQGPLDIWAQMRFVQPTLLGTSYFMFKRRYAVLGGYGDKQVIGHQNLDELTRRLSAVMYQVDDSVLDLPEATVQPLYCELSAEGARCYHDLDKKLIADVKGGVVTAANAMVRLLRLQQLTGGTLRLDDGRVQEVDDSKSRLLQDLLEDLGDEPVVVFCRFHADLDAVHKVCGALGVKSGELSGRRDELSAWKQGTTQVLAAQISSGGIGVDMTRARYAVDYSLSFSLTEYDQTRARIRRPGQTRPVTYYQLVARQSGRQTVDQAIYRALRLRAEPIDLILSEIRSSF